jgi:hypothetical protein
MQPEQSGARSYLISRTAQKTWPWFVGSAGLIVFAVLGFVVAMVGNVDQFQLQTMTTLPTMGALALFVKGWSISRLPRQVDVGDRALRIVRGKRDDVFDWDEIGWVADDKSPISQQPRITIYNTRGKKIVAISDSFAEYEQLASDVKGEFAKRYGASNEALRMRKARRTAIWMTVASLLLLGVAIANFFLARNNARAKELLETKAMRGNAKVLRRFIAPNGHTRRLEYEVREAGGLTGKRNVEVYPDFWDTTDGVEQVPVMYVPGEPEISCLVVGEVMKEDFSDNPKVMYGMCALLGVMCIVFFVAAALLWRGWELTIDSDTKRIKLKPFGTGK